MNQVLFITYILLTLLAIINGLKKHTFNLIIFQISKVIRCKLITQIYYNISIISNRLVIFGFHIFNFTLTDIYLWYFQVLLILIIIKIIFRLFLTLSTFFRCALVVTLWNNKKVPIYWILTNKYKIILLVFGNLY